MQSEGSDGNLRYFNHPFFQALIMFLGEVSCLLAFKLLYYYFKLKDNSHEERDIVKGNKNFSIWIFCLPALCDIIATSIMYIGLTLTYASSFQMLRGKLNNIIKTDKLTYPYPIKYIFNSIFMKEAKCKEQSATFLGLTCCSDKDLIVINILIVIKKKIKKNLKVPFTSTGT